MEKYQNLHLISKGRFAKVFSGTGVDDQKQYAIKVESGLNQHDSCVRNEIEILTKLDAHPGIPTIHQHGRTPEGGFFVTFPFLGVNLAQLCENVPDKKLPGEEVVRIGLAVLDILEFIHSRKVLHRDIKPENIVVASDGTVSLIDFGLSVVIDDRHYQEDEKHKQVVGTPRYWSLNVCKGKPLTYRDEFESLGYVLILLGSGSLPWITTLYDQTRYESMLLQILYYKTSVKLVTCAFYSIPTRVTLHSHSRPLSYSPTHSHSHSSHRKSCANPCTPVSCATCNM